MYICSHWRISKTRRHTDSQVDRFTRTNPFSLKLLRYLHVLKTIYRSRSVASYTFIETDLRADRTYLKEVIVIREEHVDARFHKEQRLYKHNLNLRKVYGKGFRVGHSLFTIKLTLTVDASMPDAMLIISCNKLNCRMIRPYRILDVLPKTIFIDKNELTKTDLMYQASGASYHRWDDSGSWSGIAP